MIDVLDSLDENPLPHTLIVVPTLNNSGSDALQSLVEDIRKIEGVEHARLDLKWLLRLQAIINVAIRAVIVIGVLLSLAVILIISNTIRLEILNRRDEIEIINRVGGTAAFIRRPFLYAGSLQGLLGAFVAIILINFSNLALKTPLQELVGLYGTQLELLGLSGEASLTIILIGLMLGWIASRVSVSRHLRQLMPYE